MDTDNRLLKILIVDDELPIRQRLRLFDWASCGCEIAGEAENGEEALDLCSRYSPDLIFTDIKMPVMSGLEFIERFGANLHGLPVIMVSGRGDPATFARAREAGVTAFLEKPFEEDQLLDAVQRLLPA